MSLRYKLAKGTFKNKKVPPKGKMGEDHISADQRGNDSSIKTEKVSASSPLSLDSETITEKPEAEKPKEDLSRRDLFGFMNVKQYAEENKPAKVKKKKKKKKKSSKNKEELVETVAVEGDEATVMPEAGVEEIPQLESPKPGFFKRIWNWIKSLFGVKPEVPVAVSASATNADNANPQAENKTSEEEEEFKVEVRLVQKEDDPEPLPPVQESIFSKIFNDDEEDPEDKELDRRNLLRQGVHYFAKPAVDSVSKKIDTVNEAVNKITKRVPLIRPPGAISERQFLQACTRCDACIHACPKDAIRKAPKSMGFLVMGTPYIDPIKTPCVMCDDLPCIPACEDNALLPVAREDVNMGYAILNKKNCKAYSEIFCQQCVIDCPVPGAITQRDMKPMIHKDVCTGCGVCARSCMTVNSPTAIKIKPIMVTENEILKKKMEEEKKKADAEKRAKKAAEAIEEAAARAAEEQK
jgi:ferredoxin-type protein NapG